ncbi:putative ribonuclease H protein [Nymphaea thermarum]|nr:putative ribonuclease H protein [Nymphaea thermarum]
MLSVLPFFLCLADLSSSTSPLWPLSPTREFTFSSCYLASFGPSVASIPPWSLWSPGPSSCAIAFAWLLLTDHINTFDHLQRLDISLANQCPICLVVTESRVHLFTSCSVFSSVLTYVWPSLVSSLPNPPSIRLLFLFCPSPDLTASWGQVWRPWLISAWWRIWEERNNKVFRYTFSSPDSVACIVQGDVQFAIRLKRRCPSAARHVNDLKRIELKLRLVSVEAKDKICATLGWPCDALPTSYLGLPLFADKLKDVWCQPLINKVEKWLSLWKSATLSYAGRLCLLKHVLSSVIGFWTSVFTLPKKVSRLLAASMANFLWGGDENSKARHLIAWDQVCKPYSEGVLHRLHMPKPQLGSGLDVLHYDGRPALEAKASCIHLHERDNVDGNLLHVHLYYNVLVLGTFDKCPGIEKDLCTFDDLLELPSHKDNQGNSMGKISRKTASDIIPTTIDSEVAVAISMEEEVYALSPDPLPETKDRADLDMALVDHEDS